MGEEVGSRIIEGVLSLPYRWATGPVGAKFLEGLKNKKILGTRCPKCRRVLVPARKFCPRCFVDTDEWVEVGDKGILRTFTIINFSFVGQVRKPPYIVGIIELDGADVGFTHFVGGVDLTDIEKAARELRPGMRVQAVWRDERKGDILDIEYFKPVKE